MRGMSQELKRRARVRRSCPVSPRRYGHMHITLTYGADFNEGINTINNESDSRVGSRICVDCIVLAGMGALLCNVVK